MIQSFSDGASKTFYLTGKPGKSGWHKVAKIVMRKLDFLDAAKALNDLNSPPGNRLELLRGSREGQHRIRINDQWRVCFVWTDKGPARVEVTDYH